MRRTIGFENLGEESNAHTNQEAAQALVDKLLDELKPEPPHYHPAGTGTEIDPEIADLTGLGRSNVKVKAHRAREKMRKSVDRLNPEKYL